MDDLLSSLIARTCQYDAPVERLDAVISELDGLRTIAAEMADLGLSGPAILAALRTHYAPPPQARAQRAQTSPDLRATIHALLAEGTCALKELTVKTGHTRDQVVGHVRRMVAAGQARKVRYGYYCLATDAQRDA